MGEHVVATKNMCEGWYMCNTDVSNILTKDMRFCNGRENIESKRSEIVSSKENIEYQEAISRRS